MSLLWSHHSKETTMENHDAVRLAKRNPPRRECPNRGALRFANLMRPTKLRVWFGTEFIGAANTIYGILLVLCVIFLPQGVVGALQGIRLRRVPARPGKAAEAKP